MPALAQSQGQTLAPSWSDTLHPFLSTAIAYDDNLLRVDESQVGSAGASDTYKTTAGGFAFERPIGRQKLTGLATFSHITYDRNSYLDYNGKSGNADLAWQIGNHLSGNAGAVYSEALASFTDFNSTQRNIQTYTRKYVNGTWRYHPSWQVHGSAQNDKYSYDNASQSYSNRTEKSYDAGFDFVAPSTSTVGIVLRRLEATYPNQVALGATVIRNDYTQNEAKLNVNWSVSGITNVTFLGGYVKRKHPFSSLRDDSGVNARLIGNWSPLGKVSFNGQLYREFGSAETNYVNSALLKGVQLSANWRATSKITVIANAREEGRTFQELPGVLLITAPGLKDTAHYQSVGVNYAPTLNILFKLTAFHDERSGAVTAGTTTYAAKGISFTGSAQF